MASVKEAAKQPFSALRKFPQGLKPDISPVCYGTTEEAAEKVRKADPSRTKSPLGMTNNGFFGTTEVVP
jgi:hypothetical protein